MRYCLLAPFFSLSHLRLSPLYTFFIIGLLLFSRKPSNSDKKKEQANAHSFISLQLLQGNLCNLPKCQRVVDILSLLYLLYLFLRKIVRCLSRRDNTMSQTLLYLCCYWTKWECNSQFVRKGTAFY